MNVLLKDIPGLQQQSQKAGIGDHMADIYICCIKYPSRLSSEISILDYNKYTKLFSYIFFLSFIFLGLTCGIWMFPG